MLIQEIVGFWRRYQCLGEQVQRDVNKKLEVIFSAILGALVGSFSAAALSYIYHERKEKQRLKITCRILLDETIRHSTWLKKDRLVDERSIKRFAEGIYPDLWDDTKQNLPGIKLEQFDIIRQHFKNMKEFKATVDDYNPNKSVYPIPDELFLFYKETCKKATDVLADICYPNRICQEAHL